MKEDWNHRYIDHVWYEGFGIKPPKLNIEQMARVGVEKHKKLLLAPGNRGRLKACIGNKKARAIVEFLYDNAGATIDGLLKRIEGEEVHHLDALIKIIQRLNSRLKNEGLPLFINKERSSNRTRLNKERVWLDVRDWPPQNKGHFLS